MDRNNGDHFNGPRVGADSIQTTIDEIMNNSLTKAGLIGWVKSNVGTLLEVADSLWILLRTNLSLLISAFGTLFGVLLGGGHAVLKFLFNSVSVDFLLHIKLLIIFFDCRLYSLRPCFICCNLVKIAIHQ